MIARDIEKSGSVKRSLCAVAVLAAIFVGGAVLADSRDYYLGWLLSSMATFVAARIDPHPFVLRMTIRWTK